MRKENPAARYDRAISLIKDIACKLFNFESIHMRVVMLKRYGMGEDGNRTDVITADAFSQHPTATPQRELIHQGRYNSREDSKEQPFQLFSRRDCFLDGGAALILVSDNKHHESGQLAIVFGENFLIKSIRKDDLMGNDFKYRVSKQCQELTDILKHDRIIYEATHGD